MTTGCSVMGAGKSISLIPTPSFPTPLSFILSRVALRFLSNQWASSVAKVVGTGDPAFMEEFSFKEEETWKEGEDNAVFE
eukprot:CAMPEP_0184491100 /NCGR_PEP_ID=MMETSP0113_2-20130426/19609_1 /TAXON_ID=91329 /ORGANISM="Norrisiella sphaerica, Strain BC52" /LENGTH=79 /DNA_ID=CAMNT_0026875313 /DNA_START=134 /DNA_END=373 /DNA_ORIENTATION=+